MEIASLRTLINEARKLDNPNINYSDVPKSKKDPSISRVVAKMTGNPSGSLTRVANNLKSLKDASDKLLKLRAETTADVKDVAEGFFNIEDEIHTRIIETIQFTLTLAKITTTPAGQSSNFDAEGFYTELLELYPDLGNMFNALREKYTEIIDTPEKRSAAKLLVKHNDDVGPQTHKKNMGESVDVDVDSMYSALRIWDQKFARLKRKLAQSI